MIILKDKWKGIHITCDKTFPNVSWLIDAVTLTLKFNLVFINVVFPFHWEEIRLSHFKWTLPITRCFPTCYDFLPLDLDVLTKFQKSELSQKMIRPLFKTKKEFREDWAFSIKNVIFQPSFDPPGKIKIPKPNCTSTWPNQPSPKRWLGCWVKCKRSSGKMGLFP